MTMKISSKILLVLCMITSTLPTASAQNFERTDALVNKIIPTWMQQNGIAGVAVSVYSQGTPHTYYFGSANLVKQKPITQQTIFEIGSITKLFTALLVAEEVKQGRMNLDDSLAKYLPDLALQPNSAAKQITLKELATHTSGLPDNFPEAVAMRGNLAQFFAKWQPVTPIGQSWRYSNAGFSLLGYALEPVTHMSFNQLYRSHILQPLGMNPLGITVPKKFQADYAQGYNTQGKAIPPSPVGLYPAAGDMKLSAADGLTFLRAALGLSSASPTINQAMRLTQTPFVCTSEKCQGLGWDIQPNAVARQKTLLSASVQDPLDRVLPAIQLSKAQQQFDGNALLDKTGEVSGFSSYVALLPNEQSGIIIFTNRGRMSFKTKQVARQILFALAQNKR